MKPREGMQSGVVGRALRSVSRRWAVSYQGSLGLTWPQIKLMGLWARVWSPVGWECCWGMLSELKGSVNRWWVISYLGCLHSAWPPVKPKSSSKVVSRNMDPREVIQLGLLGRL